ncbi:MAG: putative AB-hydrolase YheT [Streblomastix strix]|uniref:Putative AB-hydrolase YheT n=1 Tax=Streblomastix strix TaxID=222440 RepID=A0A5J4WKQ9_9EUKA|nr:MAG: putative AB-hydrolase YheT [Streblomastix strix]
MHLKKRLYYWANLKYGFSSTLNTIYAYKLNKNKSYRPKREQFNGTNGGIFSVDWFLPDSDTDSSPIIVVCHGINGGSNEPVVQKFCLRINREKKWKAAVVLYRGCCGTMLSTLQTYHGGFTEDLHIALKEISIRYPNAPIGLAGFSMGGNNIAKYLGERDSKIRPTKIYQHLEQNDPIPQNVKCAANLCCPFDFLYIDKHISKKQHMIAGAGMDKFVQKHSYMLSRTPQFDLYNAQNDKSSSTIDHMLTIHFFKYDSRDEFYRESSAVHYLDGVKLPMIFIQTKNDQVSDYGAFARKEIEENQNISAFILPGGAHLGLFPLMSTRRTFEEDIFIQFFENFLIINEGADLNNKAKFF